MNIILPGNALFVISMVAKLSNFALFPAEKINELYLTFHDKKEEFAANFAMLDYNSTNFIEMVGPLFVIL